MVSLSLAAIYATTPFRITTFHPPLFPHPKAPHTKYPPFTASPPLRVIINPYKHNPDRAKNKVEKEGKHNKHKKETAETRFHRTTADRHIRVCPFRLANREVVRSAGYD